MVQHLLSLFFTYIGFNHSFVSYWSSRHKNEGKNAYFIVQLSVLQSARFVLIIVLWEDGQF